MEKTEKATTGQPKPSFGERIKDTVQRFGVRLKGMLQKESDMHEGEIFVERKRQRPFVLAVLFTTLKIMLVCVVVLGCACVGLVLGVAKAYVDTTPELDVSLLTKSERTSYIYDMDGNLITTFAGLKYRDWVSIEDVPDMLINAVIAVEDVRFYRHSGVDYKRLFAAVVGSLSASSDAGGSTITQQLVKNKLLTNEVSYRRKIQEAYLALEVENTISKSDVLEAYLNDVYLGSSNYGIKTAAKDYFGKELSELTIRECAMIAGMIQAPNRTDPRKNMYERFYESGENKMDITDEHTDTVIEKMYDAGFITKEQRDAALTDSVHVLKESQRSNTDDLLYFVEYATQDVVSHLLSQRELLDTKANRAAIENELQSGGYSIYLTIDTEMQRMVQDTLANWDEYPKLQNENAATRVTTTSDGTEIVEPEPQAAAVVIDYKTGELRAIVGGREAPQVLRGWNRAYQSETEVGSSIKPLTVYGPALDLGLSPASAVANLPQAIEGWDTEKGYPSIGSEKYIGIISLRRGIVSSLNVAAARVLMENVTTQAAAQYLVNLGVDSSRVSATGSGLALGTTGITPIEMAAAYGAIGNMGEYLEPLSFTRVVDGEGRVVLDAAEIRKSRQVFKQTTAYMLVDMLTDAVNNGTGTSAKIKGMTVAGKTGTNSDYGSAYFAGITPYYSAVVWVGHDSYEQKLVSGSTGGKVAAPLWHEFMEKIHTDLVDKPIIDASPVELGLVKRTVCAVSGKLATEACSFDANGLTPITDWFDKSTAPTESCDMHVLTSVCMDSEQPASPYCTNVQTKSILLVGTQSYFASFDAGLLQKYLPNAVLTDITAEQYNLYASTTTCPLHSYAGWGNGGGTGISIGGNNASLIAAANALISDVEAYLSAAQNLSETDRNNLVSLSDTLAAYLNANLYQQAETYYERLRYTFDVIYAENPPVTAIP